LKQEKATKRFSDFFSHFCAIFSKKIWCNQFFVYKFVFNLIRKRPLQLLSALFAAQFTDNQINNTIKTHGRFLFVGEIFRA